MELGFNTAKAYVGNEKTEFGCNAKNGEDIRNECGYGGVRRNWGRRNI